MATFKVKPIINPDQSVEGKVFKQKYANTILLAKKASGKTSAILSCIKHGLVNRKTCVFIICPTYDKDYAYIEIRKYLKSKNIPCICFYGLNEIEEDGDNIPIQIISDYLKETVKNSDDKIELQNDKIEDIIQPQQVLPSSSQPNLPKSIIGGLPMPDKQTQKINKRAKPKDYLLIVDDCGSTTRNDKLANIMRKNRHYRLNVLISVQAIVDLMPSMLQNADNALVFGGHPTEKIEHLHRQLDLNMPVDEFIKLYHEKTSEKYKFLNIDVRNMIFRRCFEPFKSTTDE